MARASLLHCGVDSPSPRATLVSMALPDQIAEFDAARVVLAPQIRGIADELRLALTDETAAATRAMKDKLDALEKLLENGIAALQALVDFGYPALVVDIVTTTVVDELKAKIADQQAALKHFSSAPAVAAGIVTFNPPREG